MAIVDNLEPLLAPGGLTVLLRDLVHEHTGYYFDTTRFDVMLEKLSGLARARDFHSFLDYYYLLKYEDAGREEWGRVMDALSVQETYFWRETGQIQALTEIVAPNWFKHTSTPLHIWSAACASGEEPYTIAIALQEAGLGDYPIKIAASDASHAALERARKGLFRQRSFRCLPPNLHEKYFTRVENEWQLSRDMMKRVRFHSANLVEKPEIAHLATAPVIFCRNVFIYFSPEAIKRTVRSFAELMPAQGYLFVGASESLLKLTADFELREIRDAFVYVRSAKGAGGSA